MSCSTLFQLLFPEVVDVLIVWALGAKLKRRLILFPSVFQELKFSVNQAFNHIFSSFLVFLSELLNILRVLLLNDLIDVL